MVKNGQRFAKVIGYRLVIGDGPLYPSPNQCCAIIWFFSNLQFLYLKILKIKNLLIPFLKRNSEPTNLQFLLFWKYPESNCHYIYQSQFSDFENHSYISELVILILENRNYVSELVILILENHTYVSELVCLNFRESQLYILENCHFWLSVSISDNGPTLF